MSIFRAKSTSSIKGPHQSTPVIKAGLENDADAALIMIHGRGASAESILGLANEFDIQKTLTLRAPQAAGHTWYPYPFTAPNEQNEPHLSSALQKIFDLVEELKEEGFNEDQIYFLGFSQGACLISEFVARHPKKYGGLMVLSGGLIGIGPSVHREDYTGQLENTPIFIGCSDVDAHIAKERVQETAKIFTELGAKVTKKLYPGMGHTINMDEISHVNALLNE